MSDTDPEIGMAVQTGPVLTNYHDVGAGDPVLFLHGSGPGVSAWANWRLVLAPLASRFRCIAPDLAGFGFSTVPDDYVFTAKAWTDQVIALADSLGLERFDVVGNSFGGGIALGLAITHPERVRRLVLMGSVGVPFELTPGLDAVWGYTPDLDAMREIMHLFAYDKSIITDDLVEMRYRASLRPESRRRYEAMFPAPRQNAVDDLAHPREALRALPHSTLLLHGRDDAIIPLSNAMELLTLIERSQLHVFGQCGHWVQIEQNAGFLRQITQFLDAENGS